MILEHKTESLGPMVHWQWNVFHRTSDVLGRKFSYRPFLRAICLKIHFLELSLR